MSITVSNQFFAAVNIWELIRISSTLLGNGTQKAFWEDSDILYISLHRHDGSFYPGGTMGEADMIGERGGEGL